MTAPAPSLASAASAQFQLQRLNGCNTLSELLAEAEHLRASSETGPAVSILLDGLSTYRQIVAMLAFDGQVAELIFPACRPGPANPAANPGLV